MKYLEPLRIVDQAGKHNNTEDKEEDEKSEFLG
jgi:hypothetical protein